ncbi:MAG: SurA N-terminal domain-containing protein [Rhodospirillales bacterium]|nr:SurA N-terminal domain-containing protein [Rhodospirillales bacterium]
MLDVLRQHSKSWVIRILFMLLAISFVGWGVGDFVRSVGRDDNAIQVGDVKVGVREVQKEFDRDIARLRPLFGGKLTNEQARQMGLLDNTIQQIVSRLLVEEEARNLGVKVNEADLRRQIEILPAFQNEQGKFDRLLFQQTLANNNFSEGEFVALLRRDLTRSQVVLSVGGMAHPPQTLVDLLYRYRQEKRVAETFLVAAEAQPAPAPPSPEALAEFHKSNAQRYTAPEYRTLLLLVLKPEDIAAEIKVPEAAIAEAYQQRHDEFSTPEYRVVEQILLPDEAKAKEAAERLGKGDDFLKTAKELAGQEKDTTQLGRIEKRDLTPDLSAAVFGLAQGKPSAPIKSGFGWHIFRVSAIEVARTKSLDEVKAQIAQELAKDMAGKALYQLATKLEDEMAAGAKLEEAAAKVGLKTRRIEAIDAKGKDPTGQAVPDLPASERFLATAFATAPGADSPLVDADTAYFSLKVEKITPPTLRPLEGVRTQLVADWSDEARRKAADAVAQQALERLKAGESSAEVAKRFKLALRTTPPFTREPEPEAGLTPQLAAEMFRAKPGEAASAPVKEGVMIARLVSVAAADPAKDAEGLNEQRQSLEQALVGDLVDQFTQALTLRHGVKINRRAIDEFFAPR